MKKIRFGLHTKMAVLSFGSILIALFSSGLLVIERVASQLENEMGMRALAIARTLAQMEDIQHNVGKPGGEVVIQPLAERIRLATGVAYVVVLDNNGVRYSHPVQDRIGKKFSGEDMAYAIVAGGEYVSQAEGVLGPSVRAFVPVKVDEGTRQVGVVVVGILTPTIYSVLQNIRLELYYTLVIGLVVGLAGSVYLARRIKRGMFNLEPEEIARLLEERVALLESISEGIIHIDRYARITLMNRAAYRITGVTDAIGKPVQEIIPNTGLLRVLASGEPEYNQEMIINGVTIVTNRIPVRVGGQTVGAVATFRDKSEVQRLAEELTGVKRFIEALRVQNHEYLNKLHTIAGLIQLNRHQEAVDFIFAVTAEQQELTQFLSRRIKDYGIAGLLMGKHSRAKELKIDFEIDRNSKLAYLPRTIDSSAMVIIIGNLLENAFEAVKGLEPSQRKVYLGLFTEGAGIRLVVGDSGPGLPDVLKETVFQPGFTTKLPPNSGLGLSLVRNCVDLAGGTIEIAKSPLGGAQFVVTIKNGEAKHDHQHVDC
ncbi:ATP-binding protein [Desulforudis sp. 1088]|uniref:ATP-binding protein n=1 Tax=unclassified Candidatus Desulforudis TaxID=2635950 RepID=UPI003CE46D9F